VGLKIHERLLGSGAGWAVSGCFAVVSAARTNVFILNFALFLGDALPEFLPQCLAKSGLQWTVGTKLQWTGNRDRPLAHEDFSRKDTVKPSSDRSFIVAILAVRWPAVLASLNKRWIKLGLLLQRFVNPIVLGFLFYATVTPIALLMRLLGKDPLRLRTDPHAASYWIDRVLPGCQPTSGIDPLAT
jgi:hypothetical protein